MRKSLMIGLVCVSEAGFSNGRELPVVWPPPSTGEREELDENVGCCDQG